MATATYMPYLWQTMPREAKVNKSVVDIVLEEIGQGDCKWSFTRIWERVEEIVPKLDDMDILATVRAIRTRQPK